MSKPPENKEDQSVFAKYQDQIQEDILYSEEDEKKSVLEKPINWESYGDAYVSKKHLLQKMIDFDRPQADKLQLFVTNGKDYAHVFMVFLAKLTSDEALRYVLTLLDDLLIKAQNSKGETDLETVLNIFNKTSKGKPDPSIPPPPFGPLFAVLSRKSEDTYILALASRILTLFVTKLPSVAKETVESTFHWFVDELLSKEHTKMHDRKISLGLIGLRPLLAVNEYRALFVSDTIRGLPILMQLATFEDKRDGMISNPTKTPKKGNKHTHTVEHTPKEDKIGPNYQQIYESIYCLWSLSFSTEAQQKLTEPKLIYNLCHILKRCNRPKVVRISLSTLRNLLGVSKNNELMLSYGIMASLNLLKQKTRWADEELENDIKDIEDILAKNVDDLTSWDRYKNEVLAQQLDWTAPHKSAKFWHENHLRFEDNNRQVLRALKSIIENSTDYKMQAIACWDVGEFVRVHPNGKYICREENLKAPIMKMLHETEKNLDDEDCQKLAKEALGALQKLMITNWELSST